MPVRKDKAAITLEKPWLTCQGGPAFVGRGCEQEFIIMLKPSDKIKQL